MTRHALVLSAGSLAAFFRDCNLVTIGKIKEASDIFRGSMSCNALKKWKH
jgi:hypothetical protein